jgi:PH (Pleckstrin Homology) domain-containing protein
VPENEPQNEPDRRWRVRPELPALKAAGAVLLAVTAALSADDVAFVLLALVAAAALAVLALRDVLAAVRLAADRDGVTVTAGFAGHRRIGWAEVERLRLYESRRYGLTARLLEIDTGNTVHLFSVHDLGVQPEEALEELRAIRFGTWPAP